VYDTHNAWYQRSPGYTLDTEVAAEESIIDLDDHTRMPAQNATLRFLALMPYPSFDSSGREPHAAWMDLALAFPNLTVLYAHITLNDGGITAPFVKEVLRRADTPLWNHIDTIAMLDKDKSMQDAMKAAHVPVSVTLLSHDHPLMTIQPPSMRLKLSCSSIISPLGAACAQENKKTQSTTLSFYFSSFLPWPTRDTGSTRNAQTGRCLCRNARCYRSRSMGQA
jgi:hypothetical protein